MLGSLHGSSGLCMLDRGSLHVGAWSYTCKARERAGVTMGSSGMLEGGS